MGPRAGLLVVGLSVASLTLSAQRRGADTISADSGQVLLGTELLVVPGLPIRGIYPLSGMAVLVEQEGDSGEVVILREVRGGSSILALRPADSINNAPRAAENAALQGRPLPGERRQDDHRRNRYIEPLNVTVMGCVRIKDCETVLDRLAPLRR